MAHEIESTDGLVLTREKAWHSLGVVVDSAPTAKDAMKIAGIDWMTELQPMFFRRGVVAGSDASETVSEVAVADAFCVTRSDNGGQLGVVGPDYKPVHNSALAELVDSLALAGNAKIETAGTYSGGRKVFFLVQTDSIFVNPMDEVKNYLLVSSSHDGSLAMSARPTDIRVVCRNTFMAAHANDKAVASFRHSGNIEDKMERCREIIAGAEKARKIRQVQYEALSDKALTVDQLRAFFVNVYAKIAKPIPANPSTDSEKRIVNKATTVLADWQKLFDADRLRTNSGANAWTAFNAITEWVDHLRPVHGNTDRDEQRLFNLRNNANKEVAFAEALALV